MSPSSALFAFYAQAPIAAATPPLIEREVLPPGVQAACGDSAPGPICSWVYDATSSELLAGLAGRISPGLLQIALILTLAYVGNILVQKFLKRVVRRLRNFCTRMLPT